jgi:hypothetical protein
MRRLELVHNGRHRQRGVRFTRGEVGTTPRIGRRRPRLSFERRWVVMLLLAVTPTRRS